jgi:hypothetical protein
MTMQHSNDCQFRFFQNDAFLNLLGPLDHHGLSEMRSIPPCQLASGKTVHLLYAHAVPLLIAVLPIEGMGKVEGYTCGALMAAEVLHVVAHVQNCKPDAAKGMAMHAIPIKPDADCLPVTGRPRAKEDGTGVAKSLEGVNSYSGTRFLNACSPTSLQ